MRFFAENPRKTVPLEQSYRLDRPRLEAPKHAYRVHRLTVRTRKLLSGGAIAQEVWKWKDEDRLSQVVMMSRSRLTLLYSGCRYNRIGYRPPSP